MFYIRWTNSRFFFIGPQQHLQCRVATCAGRVDICLADYGQFPAHRIPSLAREYFIHSGAVAKGCWVQSGAVAKGCWVHSGAVVPGGAE